MATEKEISTTLWVHMPQENILLFCTLTKVTEKDFSLLQSTLHYITLKTIYSGQSESNFKDHYGDVSTMFGYYCPNKRVSIFWQNVVSDGADWSLARMFQSSSKRAIADSDADVEKTGGW